MAKEKKVAISISFEITNKVCIGFFAAVFSSS